MPVTFAQHQASSCSVEDLYNKGELVFEDSDLTYSSESRCPCGAGLAHVNARELNMRFWDCSAILKGEAIPKDSPESVKHTAQLPFAFYEIKSEVQPSADGLTTRPNAKITVYVISSTDKDGTPKHTARLYNGESAEREVYRRAKAGETVKLEIIEEIRNQEEV